jgi:hypothetical protein
MLADIVITSSGMSGFFGWGALIFLGIFVSGWIFAANYHKCDDWVTPLIAAAIANISGIIGVILGLVWIGSKL